MSKRCSRVRTAEGQVGPGQTEVATLGKRFMPSPGPMEARGKATGRDHQICLPPKNAPWQATLPRRYCGAPR